MVELKSYVVSIKKESVDPSLNIDLDIERDWDELITRIDGQVYSEDKKFLGSILPDVYPNLPAQNYYEHSIDLYIEGHGNEGLTKTSLHYLMTVTLSRSAVDWIEKVRRTNNLKEVVIRIDIQVRYIKFFGKLKEFQTYPQLGVPGNFIIPANRNQNDDRNQMDNSALRIAVTDGEKDYSTYSTLLESRYLLEHKQVTIPMTHWTTIYLPAFGYGEYLIVEIPKGNGTIVEAWDHINKAEEDLRKHSYTGALSECRQALETLRNKVDESSLPTDKKARFERLIGQGKNAVFGWISMFLHQENVNTSQGLASVEPNYYDAENALFVTKLVAKYVGEIFGMEGKDD